jgi:MscS family membrane protein
VSFSSQPGPSSGSHLPYKPGEISGVYEASLRSKGSIAYLERPVRNRLKPVDTSNPRSTFEGFLDSVNRSYVLVMEADAALKANPPTMTNDKAREIEIMAQNLMMRAQSTLYLSKVPQAMRDDVGIESVLQLKEIFDRMHLPVLDSVPDMEMVKAERERLSSTAVGNARPVRWRYPNTTIEIVEIMEGEHQGKFLFSADTVRRLDRFYMKVRDLPYRGEFSQIALEYLSAGTSKGFYEYYILTPGYLIPQASLVGRLVESLPGWFKTVYRDQTLWQWISLVLGFLLGMLFLVTLHGWLLRRPVGLSPLNRHWRRVLFFLVAAGTVLFLNNVLDDYVNLTGSVLYVSATILQAILWLSLSIVIFFFGGAIAETIVASPKIDPEGIQASYIRALFGVIGFIAAAAILISGLSKVGVSLIPLLTGIGIGGLALALAARPTIENIIASFMIFLDKPYRVGQRVNVMGQDGTVESIGLRSTKIRLLKGHLTSIPNEKMATVEIENIGRRPYIRRLFNVTITYDTPPEKINHSLEILREILSVPETREELADTATEGEAEQKPHPNEAINRPDFPPRVFFNELNADSLNILVIYWYHPPDYWDYLEHATWVNIQIMERYKAEGIDFAFPTQTLHLAGDDKRPLTVAADAAAQTAETSASEALKPEANKSTSSEPIDPGEPTDAPVEDEVLHSGDEGETGKG